MPLGREAETTEVSASPPGEAVGTAEPDRAKEEGTGKASSRQRGMGKRQQQQPWARVGEQEAVGGHAWHWQGTHRSLQWAQGSCLLLGIISPRNSTGTQPRGISMAAVKGSQKERLAQAWSTPRFWCPNLSHAALRHLEWAETLSPHHR